MSEHRSFNLDLSFLAEPEPKIFGLSGGADSLALLAHLVRSQKTFPSGGTIIPVIVDHGYRSNSAKEAAQVSHWANDFGLKAIIKRRQQPLAQGNLQAFFRNVRREALFDAAIEQGAQRIVLAHHQDDQLETFIMRKRKKSGTLGLASMQMEAPWRHLTVTRPALNCPQQALHTILKELAFSPIQDPSNNDPQFERVRVRQALKRQKDNQDYRHRMLQELSNLERNRNTIFNHVKQVSKTALKFHHLGQITLNTDKIMALPLEGQFWLISRILLACGGKEIPQRHSRIAAIYENLSQQPSKRTLAGVEISIHGHHLHFQRERGRMTTTPMTLYANNKLWWDGRYWLDIDIKAPSPSLHLVADSKANPIILGFNGQKFWSWDDDKPLNKNISVNTLLWPEGKRLGW